MRRPIDEGEVALLNAVHQWVTVAFIGLWVSGVGLVYVRTGFQLENFSPKLWTKVTIMSLMALNALALARIVVPVVTRQVGSPLLTLPPARLSIVTQIACNSLFCWTAGVSLGASVVLKTANWDLLVPLGLGFFLLMSVGGHIVVHAMRWYYREADDDPIEVAMEIRDAT